MDINFKKYVNMANELENSTDSEDRMLMVSLYSERSAINTSKFYDNPLAFILVQMYENYVDPDSVKGSLVGGAIGDALGYPIEFCSENSIFGTSKTGVVNYELTDDKIAEISDDTQMTMFTAEGIITAVKKYENPTYSQLNEEVYNSYLNWLYTQKFPYKPSQNKESKLLKIDKLYSNRAPGNACLWSLSKGVMGTLENRINDSKGCGGVMRIAPISIYLAQTTDYENLEDVAKLGASASAITHGHDLGVIPSAFLAVLIACVLRGLDLTIAVKRAKSSIQNLFENSPYLSDFISLIEKAIDLAINDTITDLNAIKSLGEGWVAEETVAIALYCVYKYVDDENAFEKAVIAAVNHGGDSDSTGAVTGNIMGAVVGYSNIPNKFKNNLELHDEILTLANDLQMHNLI